MAALILLRHAEPVTPASVALGHTDVELSAAGRAQAQALVETWQGPRPQQILCSDLRRARETLEPLLRAWGVSARYDARLREMHFGEWECRRFDELAESDPKRLAHWYARWQTEPAPGGESFAELRVRVRALLAEAQTGPAPLLLCAHAGSLRAVLVELGHCSPVEAFARPVPYAQAQFWDAPAAPGHSAAGYTGQTADGSVEAWLASASSAGG